MIGGSNQIVSHKEDGTLFLVKQVGRTELKDNIEVAYHALIACGMFLYETTVINSNTCIETGVVIAHNCNIGSNTMVLAQSQICGSTNIGDNVRVSPHGIVSNCLNIADNVTVTIGAVVVNNISEGKKVSGNFAIDHDKFLLWHSKKMKKNKKNEGNYSERLK